MENGIYVGLSRQMVLRTNMDIVANNIANVNTPGYRGQNLLFKEYISDPRGADYPLSFVYDVGQYQDTVAGAVKVTGNALDVALGGPGFLGVVGPDGKVAYTRDGGFTMDADGILRTSAGHAVAGQGGGQITIPRDSSEIHIDRKGVISNQDGPVGQLTVVEFDNVQKLDPMGDNLYTTTATPKNAEKTTVRQGALEGSNVQPVIEMTRMIDTLRSFQSLNNILQTENERLRTMIQRMTRPA
jgi:flagellar basal-body rod protein FlgF